MIRYIWNLEGRIFKDESFKDEIPIVSTYDEKIYVNILEKKVNEKYSSYPSYRVRLYFSNGEVLEGWTFSYNMFIQIEDTKGELFDGRFNQQLVNPENYHKVDFTNIVVIENLITQEKEK